MKKIIFCLLVALALFSCAVTDPAPKEDNKVESTTVDPLREGLVAEYLMEKSSFDTSGNSNHGIANGPVPIIDRFAQHGKAMRFDGVDDYIEIKNHPSLHSDRALTISVWLYAETVPVGLDNYKAIFWKGETSVIDSSNYSHREYALWLGDNGHLHFTSTPLDSPAQKYCNTAPSLIRAQKWQHIVTIIDSELGKMRIYVDGEFIVEADYGNANIRTSNSPLLLGGGTIMRNHNFNGKLDDIRIHNRALSESEIQALYKAK